jgi:indolepyruvate ferredoxin oxidoreductase beta subunit
MKLDIVFTGVGGQGIIAASDTFCEAALLDGFDVAKAETHGMAQRGGSIIAHVRIGDDVSSPLIERGTGDVVLGFEILESVRALPFLKDKGTAVLNMKYIPPATVLQGVTESPKTDELIDVIKRKALHVYEINGDGLASQAGNSLAMNTVLLGALSAIPENPVREESFRKAVSHRLKAKYLNINLKALQLGRESISSSQNSPLDF